MVITTNVCRLIVTYFIAVSLRAVWCQFPEDGEMVMAKFYKLSKR
jgi:hypothetical protein